ncbi:hypothetical protein HD806DRAFT_164487 [Xylariaceae sp. AK1471]|nr:hypothetical protein HD806DRAFT_164487 [Xylariaceae sp. AK1471]
MADSHHDVTLNPKPQARQSPSLLESLSIDAMVTILSACHSVADLHHFIQASPALYAAFLSAKRTILLTIIMGDLGSSIRDAVALLLTDQVKGPQETRYAQADHPIQRYATLPAGINAARCLPMDLVIQLVRMNRVIQYWVESCARHRLWMVRSFSNASWPISVMERHRFSQAIIRFHLLIKIQPGESLGGDVVKSLLQQFFDLFQAWELEQIAQVQLFFEIKPAWELQRVAQMQPDSNSHQPLVSPLSDDEIIRLFGIPGYSGISREMATIRSSGCERSGQTYGKLYDRRGRQQPHELTVSEDLYAREELYPREREMPVLIAGGQATDPPYGWVDALAGLNCSRWGQCLLPRSPLVGNESNASHMHLTWCLLGLALWDKERIEHLKTHCADLSWLQTGWVTRAWDNVSQTLRSTE